MAASSFSKCLLLACVLFGTAMCFTPKNVIYWGQSSSSKEGSLKSICKDSTYDIIVLAFMDNWPTSPGDSKYPGMNLAGHCGDNFDGRPNLLNCPDVASDIIYCQSQGKQIFMSLGGADGPYGFTSESQGPAFAKVIWDLFLGGSSQYRPFGNAILDGIDLDIEQGETTGLGAFVTSLRTYFNGASKSYFISSAPQCPYPDDWMGPGSGTAFTNAWFDYVWVQFYNNNCGLNKYNSGKFNFASWANWAKTSSINKNVRIMIGAPASASAAGEGYVDLATLTTITKDVNSKYPNIFGGIMMWDAGSALANNNFGAQVAAMLRTLPTGSSTVVTQAPSPATQAPTKAPSTKTPNQAPAVATQAPTKTPSTKAPSTKAPVTLAPAVGSSCSGGEMACATSETYQKCFNGKWGAEQRCQVGLTCSPSGKVIYCL